MELIKHEITLANKGKHAVCATMSRQMNQVNKKAVQITYDRQRIFSFRQFSRSPSRQCSIRCR